MGWETPTTFVTGEVVTATQMNKFVRDNPIYLLNRPKGSVLRDNGGSYTYTGTTFADIDGTNLKAVLSCSGSAVLVGFTFSAPGFTAGAFYVDIDVDGTRYAAAGADGLLKVESDGAWCLTVLVSGLSVGSHTFKPVWKRGPAGTATIYAGNGVAAQDLLPAFWAVEVA